MNGAVAIVVITDRAVEHVIAENAVVCLSLRGIGGLGSCIDDETVGNRSRTGSEKLPANLNHAGVACLNWTKLRVITDLGNFAASAIDNVYQSLTGLGFLDRTVNRDTDHELVPKEQDVSLRFVTNCKIDHCEPGQPRAARSPKVCLRSLVVPVVTTMTTIATVSMVSMSLDQIAGSGTCASTN